jgi:hypothetical protein
MLLQSRFQFTADDREALARHLCEGGYTEVASEIIDALEEWAQYWRKREAEEMARRAARDRDVASAKKINRRQGKKVVTLPRGKDGPNTFSRQFVFMAVNTLWSRYGVRIVRGPDKHQWLTDFLVELCRIAGIDRPSIDFVLKVSAQINKRVEEEIRTAQQGGPIAEWLAEYLADPDPMIADYFAEVLFGDSSKE